MLQNHKKLWTDEQVELLLDSHGHKPMEYLVRKIKKSEQAIIQKLQEITGSYSIKESAGFYTAREVAPILGVDPRTLCEWIWHREFPALRISNTRGDNPKNRIYYMDPQQIWKWVALNKERIPFRHVQTGVLLPEPEWLAAEIRQSAKKDIKRPTSWTPEEKKKAWNLYSQGINYREIASILKRPEKGTQRQLTALKKKHANKQAG